MKWFSIKRFAIFFLIYFATIMVVQIFIFESEDPVQAIIVKNLLSGIFAAVVFTYLMRNR